MRRLVFVTQRIDPDDPVLAAAVPMARALAEQVDELSVLALDAVPGALPEHVRVRLFGGGSKALRGQRFAVALARELSPRPVGVVAHQCPIYAVLAAPLVRPLRVPLLLWFTHYRAGGLLRLATAASTRVLSVAVETFPLPTSKLVAIGHGVDVAQFRCRGRAETDGTLRAVALGRTSPSKHLETVIDGVRAARARGVAVEVEIRGPAVTAEERAYRRRLESLAGDGVTVAEALPRRDVPELLASHDVLVNNTWAADKVVFEAAASCVPVLASSGGLTGLLDPAQRFRRDAPEELADRLAALAELGAAGRAELGRELRARVEAEHSVERWAERVLSAL